MTRYLFFGLLIYITFYSANSSDYKKDTHFDFLIFTQQWPITVCDTWEEENPTHTCSLPRDHESWTVHGVWPSVNASLGPQFCNRSWLFDPEKIKPIESEMIELWPNIEAETSTYSFWAHEWSKHGTCAAVLELFNSELKYFSRGLMWVKSFRFGTILRNANIIPDDSIEYHISDIMKALTDAINVTPFVICKEDKHKQYIMEIRTCFTKNLELIDCNSKDHPPGNECKPTQGVIYPADPFPPKTIYVKLHRFVTWLQWFTL